MSLGWTVARRLPGAGTSPEAVRSRRSGFAGGPGIDREGVDAAPCEGAERIINEAMAGDPAQAFEASTDDADREVPAFTRAGMACMQVAVVLDLEPIGLERGREAGFDFDGCHAE
jgi:hypothetical protein